MNSQDEKLQELTEALRSFPEWYAKYLPEIIRIIAKTYTPPEKDPETLQEMIDQNPPALRGTIFEIIETGDSWTFQGFSGSVPTCSPLGKIDLYPINPNTRIRRVF